MTPTKIERLRALAAEWQDESPGDEYAETVHAKEVLAILDEPAPLPPGWTCLSWGKYRHKDGSRVDINSDHFVDASDLCTATELNAVLTHALANK